MCVCMCAKSLQSCPILCDPMDRMTASSVHGIFQARMLEWVSQSLLQGIFLTDQRVECISPALQADSLPSEPPGKSHRYMYHHPIFGDVMSGEDSEQESLEAPRTVGLSIAAFTGR